MKKTTLCLVLAASAAPFAVGAVVVPGASLAEVHATLGSPKGQMHVNDRQVLYYERGAVELQAGRVTQVALRSPEEQALLVAKEARMRAEREEQRARTLAEGAALRDRKLADAAFLATPLAYQVSYWENFQRRYPGVPCAEPLTVARVRLNEQLEEKRRREAEAGRLAEIEERLAAAEREQDFYPIRVYSSYHGRRHYHEFGLGQITYHFNDSGTPYSTPRGSPYTTPSGNPAGNLTGAVINLPSTNPALTHQDGGRGRGRHDECGDRSDRREMGRGRGQRWDRM
jgi:hypothetical protein